MALNLTKTSTLPIADTRFWSWGCLVYKWELTEYAPCDRTAYVLIHLSFVSQAVGLDTAKKNVILKGGTTLEYDSVLISTGGK